MKKILIVNDDGVTADGIARLARAAQAFGKVYVCAPDGQRSASSHSIFLHKPLDVFPVPFPVEGVEAWSCSGTPADCARLGILNLVPGKPDVVLTGINDEYNAGTDVMYSGTLGSALEAVFQGIPAIAFSEGSGGKPEVADRYLPEVLKMLLFPQWKYGEALNVNFPACAPEEVKGILTDRFVSHGYIYTDSYDGAPIPEGGTRFTVRGERVQVAEEGSDLQALFDGYISIGTVHNLW